MYVSVETHFSYWIRKGVKTSDSYAILSNRDVRVIQETSLGRNGRSLKNTERALSNAGKKSTNSQELLVWMCGSYLQGFMSFL